ncbi:MAG: response regulator [Myxococcota bacterium]|nr:response regulator [Myxococcota bacterium]
MQPNTATHIHETPDRDQCKGPIRPRELRGGLRSTRPIEPASSNASKAILLIDDEAMVAKMSKKTLSQLGYDVTALTDAAEAMMLFASDPNRFDVVITDESMPEISGTMLAKRFLEIRSDIPIVLASGYNDEVDEDAIKSIGIRAYAKKPISIQALADLIEEVAQPEE